METQPLSNPARKTAAVHPHEAEIQEWLIAYLAQLLDIRPDQVDIAIPFERYGLDSSASIGMTGDLEAWLGCELDPALLYDYQTIEILARHLAGRV
ncbi:acyl carrier protein [Gloeobacter morelensis]|uniref:Acyl carrier protein n=1 Tax=Gloeobacter morelensis MG652769 TaxID=2781736 RepID=A0ABY3PM50_9CYAN|nr:acyl carrier protein [Gloeobacter morelensis]UFP94722.1 acyl carrier protein [Gloeobacter morelensis MG652769]